MAKSPAPEELGRSILAILQQDGLRSEQMVLWTSLFARLVDRAHWSSADLSAGLEWCVRRGFLRLDEQKTGMFFLTDAGAAALRQCSMHYCWQE